MHLVGIQVANAESVNKNSEKLREIDRIGNRLTFIVLYSIIVLMSYEKYSLVRCPMKKLLPII